MQQALSKMESKLLWKNNKIKFITWKRNRELESATGLKSFTSGQLHHRPEITLYWSLLKWQDMQGKRNNWMWTGKLFYISNKEYKNWVSKSDTAGDYFCDDHALTLVFNWILYRKAHKAGQHHHIIMTNIMMTMEELKQLKSNC